MLSWQYSLLIACRNNLLHTGMSRVKMNGGLTPPPLTSPRSAVIFVEKAAAACAAPVLKHFCSILHRNLAFTQNLGLTPLIPLLLGPTLKISVIVSRPFLTHSGFFLCGPPRSAVDKPSAARYNTFQRPSTGANLQLLRRIFSLSQCAAFVKGEPLYGRFESRYAYHQGGAFA